MDVLIAGGGPATLGLLCNAKKTGRLRDLVTPSSEQMTAGLAILERGNSLGGGSLQNYLINSNTSADGFLNCVYGYQTTTNKKSNSLDKRRKDDKKSKKEDKKLKRSTTISPVKKRKDEKPAEDENYQEMKKVDENFMKLYANLKRPMDSFEKLHDKDNEMFKMMKTFGANICPLAVVG